MKNNFNFPLFHWHLEISSKCSLACPRCPRTGPKNQFKYKATQLDLKTIQKVFSPEFIQQYMQRLLLCGGQGDPIYNTELIQIVEYFKFNNPKLKLDIVTNGSYKKRSWWKDLASKLNENDDVVFSVDGWDQNSNQLYRVNSDYASILEGIAEMVQGLASIHWSTIVFKFNQDKITEIKSLAKSLGVHKFHLVYSTKFDGPWLNESGVDPLKPDSEFVSQLKQYQKNIETLNYKKEFTSSIKALVEKQTTSLRGETNHLSLFPRCMTGIRGLYVDASGILHPCSWISHPYDQHFPVAKDNFFVQYKDQINLKEHPLIDVINNPNWEKFFSTWKSTKSSYSECLEKCGQRI